MELLVPPRRRPAGRWSRRLGPNPSRAAVPKGSFLCRYFSDLGLAVLPTQAPAASAVVCMGPLPPLCALLAEPLLSLSVPSWAALAAPCLILRKEPFSKRGCPVQCRIFPAHVAWKCVACSRAGGCAERAVVPPRDDLATLPGQDPIQWMLAFCPEW